MMMSIVLSSVLRLRTITILLMFYVSMPNYRAVARILPKIQIIFVGYNIFQKNSTTIVLSSFYSMLTFAKDGNSFVRR